MNEQFTAQDEDKKERNKGASLAGILKRLEFNEIHKESQGANTSK